MKVRELRETLAAYDQDAEVVIDTWDSDNDFNIHDIVDISLNEVTDTVVLEVE